MEISGWLDNSINIWLNCLRRQFEVMDLVIFSIIYKWIAILLDIRYKYKVMDESNSKYKIVFVDLKRDGVIAADNIFV